MSNLSSSQPLFTFISLPRAKHTRNSDHPGKRWGHISLLSSQNKLVIFGGRHNQRVLSNMFALDLLSLSWAKIDSYGQSPPARDSHSALLLNEGTQMLIFGGSGSGRKLNDTWIFSFEQRKWSKILYTNDTTDNTSIPCPREGHCVAIINNLYMMIYGGVDENENDLDSIHLLKLDNISQSSNSSSTNNNGNNVQQNLTWLSLTAIKGKAPSLRDSQSCTSFNNNTCYIFGGQGIDDKRFNDMHKLTFNINETTNTYEATWELLDIKGQLPPNRASHSAVAYKNKYLVIIGGESDDETPLNDVWFFDIEFQQYTKCNIENDLLFIGRFCHSACIINDSVVIYGGMKNAEETLDNLTILMLDNKIKGNKDTNINVTNIENVYEENSNNCNNNNNNAITNVISNNNKEGYEEGMINNDENNLLKAVNSNKILKKNITTDTYDLNDDNKFNFCYIKQESIDRLLSFSFLKKLSDNYQWPFYAIQQILNSFPLSKSIHINKFISNDKHVLSIKFTKTSIPKSDFISAFNAYNKDNNTYTFYSQLLDIKLALMRIGNISLIINKDTSTKQIFISLISSYLQYTIDTDSLVTPLVIFDINTNEYKINTSDKYNHGLQSLHLILHELYYIFDSKENMYLYFDDMEDNSVVLFISDLRRISNNIYELNFTEKDENIYYIRRIDNIDSSFNIYLNYSILKRNSQYESQIYLNEKKIIYSNPFYSVYKTELMKMKTDEETNWSTLIIENDVHNVNEIHQYIINNKQNVNCIIVKNSFCDIIAFNNKYDTSSYYENEFFIYENNTLQMRINNKEFGIYSHSSNKQHKDKLNTIKGYIHINSINEVFANENGNAVIKNYSKYMLYYSIYKTIKSKLTEFI